MNAMLPPRSVNTRKRNKNRTASKDLAAERKSARSQRNWRPPSAFLPRSKVNTARSHTMVQHANRELKKWKYKDEIIAKTESEDESVAKRNYVPVARKKNTLRQETLDYPQFL